ncbi:MAG TPA: exonuclease domain-containing protein [Patescibacteria group bacterium]|nr:exonuclease domain-containing protein [Patescibacteria group bacterium]
MPQDPLCFVDIETTGTNPVSGRIIEIGILRVENNILTETFESLVNPEMHIDPYIEEITGINSISLTSAPLFEDIKEKLVEILDGSIFIAHNVRFDYGFVRNEFRRLGVNFKNKHFCTVKLARRLYPGLSHYNLDAIQEKFAIKNNARHRAYGDAKVLWDFFQISQKLNSPKVLDDAINFVMKKPTLPQNISLDTVDNLPESPGVYLFFDENGAPIYIGKSVNIRDRVLSHFSNDYGSNTDMKIIQTIKSIEYKETAGDLSAMLLESYLIKKEKPLFNRMLRESKKMLVLVKSQNKKGYNTIEVTTIDKFNEKDISKACGPAAVENILGTFRSIKQLKDYLYQVAKENKLCPRLLGLDKGKGACLYSQMGQCNGACCGKELNLRYNMRFDDAFFAKKVKRWKFDGPIMIKESYEKETIHVIDKWCYLGSLENENESLENLKKDYIFDYDTYKILRRYIENPNNQKNISLFTY